MIFSRFRASVGFGGHGSFSLFFLLRRVRVVFAIPSVRFALFRWRRVVFCDSVCFGGSSRFRCSFCLYRVASAVSSRFRGSVRFGGFESVLRFFLFRWFCVVFVFFCFVSLRFGGSWSCSWFGSFRRCRVVVAIRAVSASPSHFCDS